MPNLVERPLITLVDAETGDFAGFRGADGTVDHAAIIPLTAAGVATAAAVASIAAATPADAPAGGTGVAAGGWATAANRDAAIATINGTRAMASELKIQVNALLAELRASKIIGQ
jgi:hypothetical protein